MYNTINFGLSFYFILEHGGNYLRQVDELMICGICVVFGKKAKVLLLSSARQAAMVTACPYCSYHEKLAYCNFCMKVHRSNSSYKRFMFLLFDERIYHRTINHVSNGLGFLLEIFSFLLKSIQPFLNSVLLLRMRCGTS